MTTLSFSAINLVLPLRRIPAVSTKVKAVSPRWMVSSTASRVVPAMGETMARSSPSSALSSVDFPTFGRPMMATLMVASLACASAVASSASASGDAGGDGGLDTLGDVIEQFGETHAMFRRDGEEVRETERVKFVRQRFALLHVDLIDRQHDRLAEAAQHCSEIAIGSGNFGAAIQQEESRATRLGARRGPA
jgi:hypothetical protein